MSRNLSHMLLASPPSWNTFSQHPTVVTYCTILYGTGVQESVCTVLNKVIFKKLAKNSFVAAYTKNS